MTAINGHGDKPAVSVIMSVYNGEKYLESAVQSILNQTFKNLEFIILNDGSTDNTKNILERLSLEDDRIILIHQTNIGLTKSLNKGIILARGKYIARQDADDVSLPDRLRMQLVLAERTDADLVLSDFAVLDDIGERSNTYVVRPSRMTFLLPRMLLSCNKFAHTTYFFRCSKDFFYDERYIYAQDFELLLRTWKSGKIIAIVPEVIARVRRHEKTISKGKLNSQQEYANQVIANYYPTLYPLIKGVRRCLRESSRLRAVVGL